VVVGQLTAAAFTADGLTELAHGTVAGNERAVVLFQRALGVDAAFVPAHVAMAKAYLQRTDELCLGRSWLEPAVAAGRLALELDPSVADAYYVLGRAYRQRGWLREEILLWQGRLRVEPDDSIANERLGWVLWFTGRADEALQWLNAAVTLRPDNPWPQFYLGNVNLALGDYREAERRYRSALQINPQHSSAQAGAIWSLLAAKKDEEARSELSGFQSREFDGDRYPLKLADIEYYLGEHENAMLHAQQALAEPEERYWPRGFLASTLVGALMWPGDRTGAQKQLDLSYRIDGDRLEGGDQGFMPHIDRAAVEAIRGDLRGACRSLGAAVAAGWRYGSLASSDRLFENLRPDPEFQSIVTA
jgi:tetratricopeptide (TPR) repeat protein